MKSEKTTFVCSECGSRSPKWLGRCPDCDGWNTYAEERRRGRARRPAPGASTLPLAQVATTVTGRRSTGTDELDRALGGGVVPGQVVLVGGDPGMGKSTLLLAAAAHLAAEAGPCLYVSGEESPGQIRLRADRLGLALAGLDVCAETDCTAVADLLGRYETGACVVDSVQVLFHPDLDGAPGSVSQVRECASTLVQAAKETSTPLFLIGHVTKGGGLAGPRTLEHLVDTVLYFEGEGASELRVLRAVKNRFGPTDEIGIFRMTARGLVPVEEPGRVFLGPAELEGPGGATVAPREGRRVLLVELQALVAPTRYSVPVRRVAGLDTNRVSMVLAVLERWGSLDLSGRDVFLNVTGGVRITEPACDLGVALAAASSALGRSLPPRTVVVGEVGLRGEVRPVPGTEARLSEAAKLGFVRAVLPAVGSPPPPAGMTLLPVETVKKSLALISP